MGNSANRPENAKYETIYFIRHNSGALKIGITLDWKRRSKDLKVGKECKALFVKKVANPKASQVLIKFFIVEKDLIVTNTTTNLN